MPWWLVGCAGGVFLLSFPQPVVYLSKYIHSDDHPVLNNSWEMHLKYNNKNKLNGHNGMLECRGNGKEIIERQKRIFLVKSLAFKRKWQFHEICFFENFSWHITNRLKPDYVVARFRKDIQSESLKNACWASGTLTKRPQMGLVKFPPLGVPWDQTGPTINVCDVWIWVSGGDARHEARRELSGIQAMSSILLTCTSLNLM